MKIDKNNLEKFRIEFAKAVAKLEKDFEVKISLEGIRYSSDNFTGKIEVTNKGGKDKIETDYELYRRSQGLPEIFTQIKFEGKILSIIGFKPRSYAYPVIVKDIVTGAKYKLSIEDAIKAKVIK